MFVLFFPVPPAIPPLHVSPSLLLSLFLSLRPSLRPSIPPLPGFSLPSFPPPSFSILCPPPCHPLLSPPSISLLLSSPPILLVLPFSSQEMSSIVESVRVLTSDGETITMHHEDLSFSYRSSCFQRLPHCVAIVGATLRLAKSEAARGKQMQLMDR